MDENMRLILEEFAKINTKLDQIDIRVTGLESRMTDVGTVIKEAELAKVNTRLGMIELKLDKLQEQYEKLDADVRVLSGETASGFYKIKHQISKLEDQGGTIVKIMELRGLSPYRE